MKKILVCAVMLLSLTACSEKLSTKKITVFDEYGKVISVVSTNSFETVKDAELTRKVEVNFNQDYVCDYNNELTIINYGKHGANEDNAQSIIKNDKVTCEFDVKPLREK